MKRAAGKLYAPRPVEVLNAPGGSPESVAGSRIDSVREEWLVEDRWWTGEPIRRHYLEVVLRDGRCVVIFRDLETGRWWEQR